MFVIALIIILWIILGLVAYKLESLRDVLEEGDFVIMIVFAPFCIVLVLLHLAVEKLKDFVDSL